jgi:outer membrane protein OmpA-like peptidoglycan-associated protein
MKWKLAGLLTVFLVETHVAPPADACGVKLTVKSSTPRKAVAHSSNPSDVLLLGNPPRRLELDLAAAGHRVDVAPTASAAKKKSYAVVVTDSNLEGEARSNFGGAVVVVRSGDTVADMRSVEQQVARKPVRTEETRVVVAARTNRTPIAAGPSQPQPRRLVSASEPKDTQPEPTSPPERVAVVTPKTNEPKVPELKVKATEPKVKATEPKVTEVTPPSEPKPKMVAKANSIHDEVYFPTGGDQLGGPSLNGLAKAVRWLTDNSDVHVVIEGHADPTGSPEGNLALSQKRAEWVRNYLVSAGIDESRLEVIAYGDTRLRYGRTSSRNRRVAIVVK